MTLGACSAGSLQAGATGAVALPAIIDVLPIAVAVVAVDDGRIVAASRAWRTAFALHAEPVRIDAVFVGIAPLLAEAGTDSAPIRRSEVAATMPGDGTRTWWDLHLSPHPDAGGHVLVEAREVTSGVLARREMEAAREAERAAAGRLELAHDAAGVGTWEYDLATDRQSWSPEQFRLHGMDPATDEPPGCGQWMAMVHPEDRPKLAAAAEEGLRTAEGRYQVEFRLRRADTGEWRWLLCRGRVVGAARDGRPRRILGVNIDVTERRRAEEALREREERLRLACAAGRVYAWDWDIASGRVAWLDGLEAELGLPPDGFAGTVEAFRALVHPDDLPAVEAALARALSGETEDYRAEFRMRRADGSWRWAATRGAVLRDAAGQPIRVLGADHDISERKAAEAAASAERARLAALLEHLPMGVAVAEAPEGRIVFANAANRRMFGRQEGMTLAASAAAAPRLGADGTQIPPDELPLGRALWRGEAIQDAPLRRASLDDGSLRDILVSAAPVRDEAGRVSAAIATFQDVTGRRRTEEALAESEARLRSVLDATTDCVKVLGPEGWLESMNVNGLCLMEIDDFRMFVGRPWDSLWPEESRGRVRQAVAAARAGRADRFEAFCPTAKGTPKWWDVAVSPVRDADGAVPRIVSVSRDITERRAAEAALVASEARYRSFVEASSPVIWTMTPDGRVDEPIPAWQAYTGQSFEQARGHGFLDAIHAEDRAAVIAAWQGALARADLYEVEYRLRRHDGAWRSVVARGAPVRDAAGRILEWIGTCTDITERKAAEAALAASEARLRRALAELDAVYGSVPVGMALVDRDFRYVSINAALARFNGQTVEAHLGRTIAEIVPELWPALEPLYRAVLEQGEAVIDLAILGRTAGTEGEDRHWLVSYLPVRDETGTIWAVSVAVRDVTAQRQAEAALRESEARYRALFDSIDSGFCVVELRFDAPHGRTDYRVLEANPAFHRHTGFPEAILGRWLREATPELEEHWYETYGRIARTGTPERFEQGSDMLGRWFDVYAFRIGAPEQRRVAILFNDISPRRRMEATLRESEARFRALAESFPGFVFEAAADGRNTYTNRQFQEYTGLSAEALLGDGWLAALHPDDRARAAATWEAAVRSGGPYEAEYRFRSHDGAWRCFLCRGAPERAEHGTILRWHGAAVDISDIVAAREQTRHHAAELERRVAERTRALGEAAAELAAELKRREEFQAVLLQAQKLEALGQLTGGVAHDFGNVLAAVIGSYRLIEEAVGENEFVAEVIGHGRHAADRARHLINQLMSFARREDMQPTATDPGAVLRRAEDMVLHTIGRGSRCDFAIAENVWPVLVDPVRLETVLLNLAANARDAMPDGGTLTLSARNAAPEDLPPDLSTARDYVIIGVADTGAGMDEPTLRRATEPFFTTKPRGRGTGLGLPSVHGFATQSGGALRLRSRPGEGTSAEIFLPRAAVVEAGWAAEPDADAPAHHGDATILVVDDDDPVRAVVAALLRQRGYRVLEAPSAESAEAIAIGAGVPIDMLVTDVQLGGAAGPTLAARLRVERPDLPVLYITAHAGAIALGDAPVLRKPFTEEELARAVLRRLGRAGPPAPRFAAPSDRLRERLRQPALREAYRHWLALQGATAGALPSPAVFALGDLPADIRDHAFLAEPLGPLGAQGFRYRHVGRALEDRMGRALTGETVGGAAQAEIDEAIGGTLGAAYRRCAESRAPQYDYARFALGDGGGDVLLERLILPLSADGLDVTHVAGITLLTELAPAPGRDSASGG